MSQEPCFSSSRSVPREWLCSLEGWAAAQVSRGSRCGGQTAGPSTSLTSPGRYLSTPWSTSTDRWCSAVDSTTGTSVSGETISSLLKAMFEHGKYISTLCFIVWSLERPCRICRVVPNSHYSNCQDKLELYKTNLEGKLMMNWRILYFAF